MGTGYLSKYRKRRREIVRGRFPYGIGREKKKGMINEIGGHT